MTEENLKVAVRVRPFNKREIAMSAELIVDMKNNTTYLRNPEEKYSEPRSFTFDHSYWSFDGCRQKSDGYFEPDPSQKAKNYCDQKLVFNDLGVGVLTNAWDGYNSTLFAYGQTGSGKSWSVVGYGINKGIIPQFCENLFKEIEKRRSEGAECEYEVNFSMLEIYNEQVRDLLSGSKAPRGGLKVRQHPKKGFYAEGLTNCPVSSYSEIQERMEEGTTNRTVASTNMNATSSRAHTVVEINFLQKFKNAAGEETTKSAIVNLVDLAGSERADSTGATGERLKEGANINKSLSSLGNCIAALADRAQGKNVKVPFRDSILTKLLKNALGGNSKTFMIAAISPADVNYDETLSTLRYADRAKQIKTKVSVNEDPTDKLIRDLQEENEKLKKMLESGSVTLPTGSGEDGIEEEEGMSPEEVEELKKQLREEMEAEYANNMREMEEMKKTFQEKLEASQKSEGAQLIALNAQKKLTIPHLSNLNYDPQLSGRILHFIEDKLIIGNGKDETANVVIKGPSIQTRHGELENTPDGIKLKSCGENCLINVNGVPLEGVDTLSNGDRLIFGTTQYYVFIDPRDTAEAPEVDISQITFEMAQEELTQSSVGGPVPLSDRPQDSRQMAALQGDLATMLPAVQQANSIAEELGKQRKFELILTPPEGRGDPNSTQMQVYVKVTELDTGLEWMWSQRKFEARKFKMEEMYDKFENNEEWDVIENEDPFIEEPSNPMHIGSVKVWLVGLAHYVDTDEVNGIDIIDYRGYSVGKLSIVLQPCDASGRGLTPEEAMQVDEPHEMVNKDIHFLIKIKGAQLFANRFKDLYCRYRLLQRDNFTVTGAATNNMKPVWNHEKQFSFCPMTREVVILLATGAMSIELWGRQVRVPRPQPLHPRRQLTSRQTMLQLAQGQYVAGAITNARSVQVNPEKVKFAFEMAAMKKRQAKIEQKMKWLRQAVEVAEDRHVRSIPVACLKGLLEAQSESNAQGCYALIVKDDDEPVLDGGKAEKRQRKASGSSISSSSSSSSSSVSEKKLIKKISKEKKHSEKQEKQPKKQERPSSADHIESCACHVL